MPLPTAGNRATAPNPAGLSAAANNHPPVTAGNDHFGAKTGNLTWLGNTMQVSGTGAANYWYIPAEVNKVSFCTVPCGGGGDAYVISDQYGGCEYHELYNAHHNMLAFLHVYRGDGHVTQYHPAQGWVLRSTKRSSAIATTYGMAGSNWSISLINRTTATVQSKFIHLNGTFTVTGEDNGDAPYPAPAPAHNVVPAPAHGPNIGAIARRIRRLLPFH